MNETDSKWYIEVIERLARLEAKLDHVNEVRDTANRADANANKALQQAADNADDIDRIRSLTKWAIGLTVTGVGIFASAVIGVLAIVL